MMNYCPMQWMYGDGVDANSHIADFRRLESYVTPGAYIPLNGNHPPIIQQMLENQMRWRQQKPSRWQSFLNGVVGASLAMYRR